jgi:hypothetical protein
MKKFVVAASAVVASLAVIGSAAAASLPSSQVLRYEGGGAHNWNRFGDSPLDSNTRALRLNVGNPDAGDYVAAYSNRSLHIATDAEAVTNLSFDFKRTAYVGAGAPRISVAFENGHVGFLSASYCDHPLASSGDVWGRADFTRFKNNCSIFVAGVQYDADGSRSAWSVYTDAHPDQIVSRAYLVADESGNYRIDRLSLGAGVMYVSGDRVGKLCTTEASC